MTFRRITNLSAAKSASSLQPTRQTLDIYLEIYTWTAVFIWKSESLWKIRNDKSNHLAAGMFLEVVIDLTPSVRHQTPFKKLLILLFLTESSVKNVLWASVHQLPPHVHWLERFSRFIKEIHNYRWIFTFKKKGQSLLKAGVTSGSKGSPVSLQVKQKL